MLLIALQLISPPSILLIMHCASNYFISRYRVYGYHRRCNLRLRIWGSLYE
jgi:hypothetical protein